MEVTNEQKADHNREDWIQGRVEANNRYRTREGTQQTDIQNNDKRQRRLSPIREQKE